MNRSACDEVECPTIREETAAEVPLLTSRPLPFSQIPHTSKLFLDFLASALATSKFYPRSVHFQQWFKDEAGKIRYDAARREQVCAILERQCRAWGASGKALANVERLRQGAAAVVTGQQVALFGGPAFSIYKALTAVKLAQEATASGVDAVPIFWLATYDHDLAEVNHVSLPGQDGSLHTLTTTTHGPANTQVGAVKFGDEITPLVEQAESLLGLQQENPAAGWLRESYRPGETFGTAFAKLYARMFAEWGVIVLDASDPELHRIAQPIYKAAVERAEELSTALLTRGEELESAGYHQQVKVTESSVLVFATQDGARTAVHRRKVGTKSEFVIGEHGAGISLEQFAAEVSAHPQRFSPNVLLRPVVQDFLLPTLAYIGGAAEIAYFAQAGAVYEKLSGRVTPVLPRFSATLLEAKAKRMLEKKRIALTEVFAGPEALRKQVASSSLPADLIAAFDTATSSMASHMSAIQEKIAMLDPTLVDAVQTAASKTQYQLEKLKAQAARAEAQKSELIGRFVESISQAVYPNKGLQERSFAAVYFVAHYGTELLKQLHDVISADNLDHQIIEL